MAKRKVSVAVIGAGTAGLNARREVEKAGKSHVLIESGPYGTTCARVGCMPSKLFIAAADAAHAVADADPFGIVVDGWRVDGRRVMERVQAERDRFVGFVVSDTESIDEDLRIRGRATFTGPNTLVVDDDLEIEFDAAVVATGSSTRIPDALDAVRDEVLTNDEFFELDDLPKSLAMFGTGIIGLELGQALARLGVKVCFFNPFNALGFFQDPVVTDVACEVLSAELQLNLGIDLDPVQRVDGGFKVSWRTPEGEQRTDVYERVFSAAGRIANIHDIGLDRAGVSFDDRGKPQGWNPHTCRIGKSDIYLAGDATSYRPILHEAADEGRLAGANAALHPHPQFGRRKIDMGVAFTQPNMAFVGKRWKELGEGAICGQVSFANQGRSRVMRQNQGVLRLYANPDAEFVGAEMFAPRGEHLAHLLAWSGQAKLTIPDMLSFPFYHPTVEEGLRTALRDAAEALHMATRCPPEDRGSAPAD